MKLRIKNCTLNQRALTKIGLIGLVTGLYIGFGIYFREQGKSNPTVLLIIFLCIIIPSLVRGIKKDIDDEN